jgi:hypothetical protein
MENTRTRLCFLNIDSSEGKGREKEGEQLFIGKNILAERKEKQSRLEMCVDVEYVQKKCTHIHTHSSHLHIFSFLELPHARPLVYIHTLPLRNVANKEKNGRCTTLDLGYVVVEITKKKRKDKEFTITLLSSMNRNSNDRE